MNTEQLQAALAECETAYREKTGTGPLSTPALAFTIARGWRAFFYGRSIDDDVSAFGDCPEAAVNSLFEEIKALPNSETFAVRDIHAQLGDLIDKARRIGIDAKHVDPLVQTARDMADSAPEMKVAE